MAPYCASIHGLGYEDCHGNQDVVTEIYEPNNKPNHTFNIFTRFQRTLVYKFTWYDNPHLFMLNFYDNNEQTPIDIRDFIIASSTNNIQKYQISNFKYNNRIFIMFFEDEYPDFVLMFIKKPKMLKADSRSWVVPIDGYMEFSNNPIRYFVRIKKIYREDIPFIGYSEKEENLEKAA